MQENTGWLEIVADIPTPVNSVPEVGTYVGQDVVVAYHPAEPNTDGRWLDLYYLKDGVVTAWEEIMKPAPNTYEGKEGFALEGLSIWEEPPHAEQLRIGDIDTTTQISNANDLVHHDNSGWDLPCCHTCSLSDDGIPAVGSSHDSGSSWDTASTPWDSSSSWGDSGSHDGGYSHEHGGTHESGTGMDSGSIF